MNIFFKILFLIVLTTTNGFSAGRMVFERVGSLGPQSRAISRMIEHKRISIVSEDVVSLKLEPKISSRLVESLLLNPSHYHFTSTPLRRFGLEKSLSPRPPFFSGAIFVQKRFFSANSKESENDPLTKVEQEELQGRLKSIDAGGDFAIPTNG